MTDAPSPSEKQELEELDQEARRPVPAGRTEVAVVDAARARTAGPVNPVRLKDRDTFSFDCHRGVSCWNTCCHGADVTLTPFDILRLTRRLGISAREFLERYTVPAIMESADMPVVKLKMGGVDGRGPCSFLADEGCTVYSDRPATCRYYPLGRVSIKIQDADTVEDFHVLVREGHCRGHEEAKSQTIAEFRHEQGIEPYDRVNRGWTDILMKLASWRTIGGPGGRAPSLQVKKMFLMVSTDVETFRRFVFGTRFLQTYEIDPEVVERLKTDDEAVLQLGFDWLKNVLFNEPTLHMREEVIQGAIAAARAGTGGA
jgi:Fe-S-cluster containining protein